MAPFHIPLPRLYQTLFSLLLAITLILLVLPFLTLIPQFPRPTTSRRFTTPLILFASAYFVILVTSLFIYSHRLWKTRKKLEEMPNRRVDFTEIGGRRGDKVRERVKRNIARSAVVGYVGRPRDEDGGAEGKGGRDGVIREVWGLIGAPGGHGGWEDEEVTELRIGYELIRWAGKEYEKDERLWEAVMRGVGRVIRREEWEDDDLEEIDEEEEWTESEDGVQRVVTRTTDGGSVVRMTTTSTGDGGGSVRRMDTRTTEEEIELSLVTTDESRFRSTGSEGDYVSLEGPRGYGQTRGLRRRNGSGDWNGRDR